MKVEEIITNKIIEQLQKGVVPWCKPWRETKGMVPKNLITKKEYHGVNRLLLGMHGYSFPFWITFNQVKAINASVKKGEKATPVIYWNVSEHEKIEADGSTKKHKTMILRYYNVFNVEQCEGIKPEKIPLLPVIGELTEPETIDQCEGIVSNMPEKPPVIYGGNEAYYQPSLDTVNIPDRSTFRSKELFYSTLFHELVHATGHQKRCNRKGVTGSEGNYTVFGSPAYAKEELTAEIGATFLCHHSQIDNEKTFDNSVAYCQSWLKRLQDDSKLIIYASANAEKAVNYILCKEDGNNDHESH
jgi:antirestriction protein ArdC